jgi:hypothetical protein
MPTLIVGLCKNTTWVPDESEPLGETEYLEEDDE